MLTGAGGHMGLSVGPDRVFLVDDQFAPLASGITADFDARFGGGVIKPDGFVQSLLGMLPK